MSRLVEAVARARDAAVEEAAEDMGPATAAEAVGEHLEARPEDDGAVTHFFAARHGGYRGWQWSVTLACPDEESPVTVSEVVLRTSASVALRYVAAWLGGQGAVALNGLMEDAATAEICRAQLW